MASLIRAPGESVLLQKGLTVFPLENFRGATEGRFVMQVAYNVRPIGRCGDRDVGLRTTDNSHVRITARHPNHKVICTITGSRSDNCFGVVSPLFPDVCLAKMDL